MAEGEQIRILLIEDSSTDALLFKAQLHDEPQFDLQWERRLSSGLKRIGQGGIDVILLDLNLPDSMGLDTFRTLHSQVTDLPVVILTGYEDEELAVAAVREGAQDYLPKAALDGRLLTRSIRFAIERQGRRSAEKRLELTEQEFDAARQIQMKLLPEGPPALPGFDIAGECHPAAATGGDYFDYIPMAHGSWGVVIADVSNHGFAPALIMAGTRRVLRTLAAGRSEIGDVLTIVNRAVIEDTQDHHFVTLFFAQIDPQTRSLTYAGAGHGAYLIKSPENVIELESTSYPLGMMEDVIVRSGQRITLEPGQILLLLTDGFREAQAPDGRLFGVQSVLDIVHEYRNRSAQKIVDALFEAVRTFCHPHAHQDDVTAVVIKVEHPTKPW